MPEEERLAVADMIEKRSTELDGVEGRKKENIADSKGLAGWT
jgi:hypothetical protein